MKSTANSWSTGEAGTRDLAATCDGREVVPCPAKGGQAIACARCVASQSSCGLATDCRFAAPARKAVADIAQLDYVHRANKAPRGRYGPRPRRPYEEKMCEVCPRTFGPQVKGDGSYRWKRFELQRFCSHACGRVKP